MWYSYIDCLAILTTKEHSNCKIVFIDDSGAYLRWGRSMCPETRIIAKGRYRYPKYTVDFINEFYNAKIKMP